MTENQARPEVTLHIVSSLDGFIAREDNSVSWLEDSSGVYEAGVSIAEEEIAAFVKGVDCYVMGSRTYEHALELGWPYGDTPCLVLTRRRLQPARPSVEFHSGDVKAFLDTEVAPRFRNVWIVGGAILSQSFLGRGLVDEVRLTIAPVLLGSGLRFVGNLVNEQRLDLQNVRAYRNGFVDLHYSARG
ncbi:dihydrofolate reductase family protein [Occallatibacter savannae]|uniref:dihydrofolate reductase family protein n=1 Tax=Occallatibacter savannae TaxID=1002691 RepID=UPI001EF704BA|nr:dihydrofolate reductase family protein [Occallatibacter savannae]